MTETTRAPQGGDWEAVADSLAWALAIVLPRGKPEQHRGAEDALRAYNDAKAAARAGDSAA